MRRLALVVSLAALSAACAPSTPKVEGGGADTAGAADGGGSGRRCRHIGAIGCGGAAGGQG